MIFEQNCTFLCATVTNTMKLDIRALASTIPPFSHPHVLCRPKTRFTSSIVWNDERWRKTRTFDFDSGARSKKFIARDVTVHSRKNKGNNGLWKTSLSPHPLLWSLEELEHSLTRARGKKTLPKSSKVKILEKRFCCCLFSSLSLQHDERNFAFFFCLSWIGKVVLENSRVKFSARAVCCFCSEFFALSWNGRKLLSLSFRRLAALTNRAFVWRWNFKEFQKQKLCEHSSLRFHRLASALVKPTTKKSN